MSGQSPDICISETNHREASMIYEQRIYTCIPGRLPALLKRFEEHTLKIWDKHGFKQAGFSTVLVGDANPDLHYMLAEEPLPARESQSNTFLTHPPPPKPPHH